MTEFIEKPDMRYILHINSDKKIEKRLIDFCLESVVDVFEDTGLTADLNPVKRGRWENEYLEDDIWWAECSNCKQETHSRYGRPSTYRYCPNCGARMDGDKANNVRNLTDEETEIYESWIDHEAKDAGVNIMDGEQNG